MTEKLMKELVKSIESIHNQKDQLKVFTWFVELEEMPESEQKTNALKMLHTCIKSKCFIPPFLTYPMEKDAAEKFATQTKPEKFFNEINKSIDNRTCGKEPGPPKSGITQWYEQRYERKYPIKCKKPLIEGGIKKPVDPRILRILDKARKPPPQLPSQPSRPPTPPELINLRRVLAKSPKYHLPRNEEESKIYNLIKERIMSFPPLHTRESLNFANTVPYMPMNVRHHEPLPPMPGAERCDPVPSTTAPKQCDPAPLTTAPERSEPAPSTSAAATGSCQPIPSTSAAGRCELVPSTSAAGRCEPVPSTPGTARFGPIPSTSGAGQREPVPSSSAAGHCDPVPSMSRARQCDPVPSVSRAEQRDPVLSTSQARQRDPVPSTTGARRRDPVPSTSGARRRDPVPSTSRTRRSDKPRPKSPVEPKKPWQVDVSKLYDPTAYEEEKRLNQLSRIEYMTNRPQILLPEFVRAEDELLQKLLKEKLLEVRHGRPRCKMPEDFSYF